MKNKKKIYYISALVLLLVILAFVLHCYIALKINTYNYVDAYLPNRLMFAYGYQGLEFVYNVILLLTIMTVMIIRGLCKKDNTNSIWIYIMILVSMEFGNYFARLIRLFNSTVMYSGHIEQFHQQYGLYITIFSIISLGYYYYMMKNITSFDDKKDLVLRACLLTLISTMFLQSYYYILLFNQYVFVLMCTLHFVLMYFGCIVVLKKRDKLKSIPQWYNLKIILINVIFIGIRLLL